MRCVRRKTPPHQCSGSLTFRNSSAQMRDACTQRQPVKSLLASRETLLGDGFGILSFRSFFSFLFLFGLLLLAPLLLSNSSPHPKSPTIFVGIIFVSDPSTPASYLRCLFPHPLRTESGNFFINKHFSSCF